MIYGENVVYEYFQPATVKELPVIQINSIAYGYRYVNNSYNNDTRGFGDQENNCMVNINCPEGNAWQLQKRAVTRIDFPVTNPDRILNASGALVNNTNNDFTPYVLTAHHVITKASLDADINNGGNNDASQWIFYWDYEHSGCNNSSTEPLPYRTSIGATVVANKGESDFALLKIHPTQDPRYITGFFPYYLGWDRTENVGSGGVCIHHPKGDVKKISTYAGLPASQSTCFGSSNWSSYYWEVNFVQTANGFSVTQEGSSGSPLINSNKRLIGQLQGTGFTDYCPVYRCDDPAKQKASFGKFSVSWTGNNNPSIYRRLDYWLAPGMSNPPSTLDGLSTLPPNITGPDNIFLNGSGDYSVSNAPSGFTWGCSPNLSLSSTAGGVNVTPISCGNTGWISINYGGVELMRKNITVSGIEIIGDVYYCNVLYFTMYTMSFMNPVNYQLSYTGWASPGAWYMVNCLYQTPWYGMIELEWWGDCTVNFTVVATSTCGVDYGYKTVSWVGPSSGMSNTIYYPNPASDILNVEIDTNTNAQANALEQKLTDSKPLKIDKTYDIRLYDGKGHLRRHAKTKGGKVEFKVSHLPGGIYYLHIYDGASDKPEIRQIMVEH